MNNGIEGKINCRDVTIKQNNLEGLSTGDERMARMME